MRGKNKQKGTVPSMRRRRDEAGEKGGEASRVAKRQGEGVKHEEKRKGREHVDKTEG